MNRHGTDTLSLTFGLVYLGVVAWWLLALLVDVTVSTMGWFVAGVLILSGLVGLIMTARGGKVHR